MIFNSLPFLIFIVLFFPLYFACADGAGVVILLASYIFYGWWDWRFLGLILFSTVMDCWFGMWISYIDDPETTRAAWQTVARSAVFGRSPNGQPAPAGIGIVLAFSMVMNLGFLGYF